MTLVFADGAERTIDAPLDEAPVAFFFPVFAAPAVVSPQGYSRGVRVRGSAMVAYGNEHQTIVAREGAKSFRMSQTTTPVAFARMIGKIAYAMAFADGSLQRLSKVYPIVSSILGETDEIGRWVGSYSEHPVKRPGLLHHLVAREHRDLGLLVYEVQLFADSQAPLYSVVLGTLASATPPTKPLLLKSGRWARLLRFAAGRQ